MFEHVVRPRYAEIDAQGVVFNAHWLTYFDDACTRFFGHLGFDPKELFTAEGGGFDCMLVAAQLSWKGSAGFDDEVRIAVSPTRLGNSSFDLTYVARVNDQEVVTAVITYVSVKPGTKESVRVPDVVRKGLGG
jgi:acyl-CoA thioester hydrolase